MSPTAISFLSCQKRYGRKERWTRGACCGTLTLGPNLKAAAYHTIHTFPHRTTRRLLCRNQICQSLRLFRCKQCAVQTKSGMLYGFAGHFSFRSPWGRSKEEVCLFLGSITPQKLGGFPNSIRQIFNGYKYGRPLNTKTQTSEAFVFWKGRATQWTSFRARAEARDMEFVRTSRRRHRCGVTAKMALR